jgi:tetratricopeptide (TPR) repeat protein
MAWRRHLAAAALAAALQAQGALAQSEGLAALCAGADPARAAEACARLLERGGLSPAQAARAEANLGAAALALDRPDRAEAAFERALALDPALAEAWAGRARAREARGLLAQAAVDWNQAARRAPRDPAILTGRGAFRLRAGNAAGALADFDAAQRAAPRDMSVAFNRGLALAELGRDAEAERMFSAVIANDPSDVGAWLNRGRLRVSRDREAALGDFDAAVARAGEWSTPYLERGALLYAMGRTEAANRDFRRAWELGHRSEYLNERMLEMGAGQ